MAGKGKGTGKGKEVARGERRGGAAVEGAGEGTGAEAGAAHPEWKDVGELGQFGIRRERPAPCGRKRVVQRAFPRERVVVGRLT